MPFTPGLLLPAWTCAIARWDAVPVWAADDGASLLLGDDFFPWMVLALGAAMIVGNVLALLRPPADEGGTPTGTPARAPVGRAVAMIVVGAVAAVWGIASLLS